MFIIFSLFVEPRSNATTMSILEYIFIMYNTKKIYMDLKFSQEYF